MEPSWYDELLAAVDGVGLVVPDQPSVVVPPSGNPTWRVRQQNDPDEADRTQQGYRNGDIAACGLEQLARAIALPVQNSAVAD